MLPINFADGAARITGVAPQTGAANSPAPAEGAATPSKFADVLRRQSGAGGLPPAAAAKATTEPSAAEAKTSQSSASHDDASASAPAGEAATASSTAPRNAADAKSADAAKTRARLTGCIRTPTPQPATAAPTDTTALHDQAGSDPKEATADAAALNADALLPAKGEPVRLVPIKSDPAATAPIKGEPVKLVPIKLDTIPADGDGADGRVAGTSTPVAGGNDGTTKGNDDRTEIGRRIASRGMRGDTTTPAGKAAIETPNAFARTLAEAGASRRTERTEPMAAAAPVTPAPLQSNDAASAVAQASVSVPVDSADFAAALGLQVSVLANQGVEKAELHLNPAEMGPVSVAISLDGKEARVEFGADLAATRQAIEAGLPELASALRDAGFTLAGGGVSDQASQSQQQQGRPGERDGSSHRGSAFGRVANDAVTMSEPVRRAVARAAAGGVDLYA